MWPPRRASGAAASEMLVPESSAAEFHAESGVLHARGWKMPARRRPWRLWQTRELQLDVETNELRLGSSKVALVGESAAAPQVRQSFKGRSHVLVLPDVAVTKRRGSGMRRRSLVLALSSNEELLLWAQTLHQQQMEQAGLDGKLEPIHETSAENDSDSESDSDVDSDNEDEDGDVDDRRHEAVVSSDRKSKRDSTTVSAEFDVLDDGLGGTVMSMCECCGQVMCDPAQHRPSL